MLQSNRFLILAFLGMGFCFLSSCNQNSSSSSSIENENEEKETGAEKQLLMWFQSKGYPNPSHLNEKYQHGWQQFLDIRKQTSESVARTSAANWQSLGDVAGIGGRILCITVDPGNSNILWAGSASGGIWKSVNAGSSWQAVETGFPVLGVSSIIVHPSNSNIIYAGTGEVYRVDTSNIGFNVWKCRGTYGVGILKSTDGGASWTQVMTKTTDQLFGIQMLKFDPSNSDRVYACATDGLYRTNDAGNNWNRIFSSVYISDVVINPLSADNIVIGVGNMVNADKGIYRTTNGLNASPAWTKITTAAGLPSSFDGYIRLDNIGATRLYASIGGAAGGDELYLSTDFGLNWNPKSGSGHCSFQYWFAHALAINPSNTNEIMIGGVDFYEYNSTNTTTGGVRTTISSGSSPIHSDHHDITYDPNNTNIIYVACDGGVYKTVNGGANWNAINTGLRATQFYAPFGVHPSSANVMIGGLQDNGVVRYNGTSWISVFGGDGGPSAIASNGTTVLASNDARGVRRSLTGTTGSFGSVLSQWAFSADDRTAFMAPLAISMTDANYQYVASDNIHITTNGTALTPVWSNTSSSSTAYIEQQRKTAIALAVSPTNRNKIYVSTSNIAQNTTNDYIWVNGQPNIFKTTTPASTPYTSIKGSLPDRFIMDFAISPTNDDSVFIALGGFGTAHVYVTGDGGATWTSRGAGLPDVPFNALVFDPLNSKVIYAGCDFGVYVSPDRGQTWVDYNNGFWDATLVMDLQISSDNKLIAATHGKGVFRSDLYSGGTLPSKLIDFTGVNRSSYNQLRWIVTEEQNVSRYELERSLDGFRYQRVATKQALTSTVQISYSADDPVVAGNTEYYYRLKTIDQDGSYTYSSVVFLRAPVPTKLTVLNNPFRDQIRLQYSVTGNQTFTVHLYNAAGALLRKQDYQLTGGSGIYTMDAVELLPAGVYHLSTFCGDYKQSFKLVKQ